MRHAGQVAHVAVEVGWNDRLTGDRCVHRPLRVRRGGEAAELQENCEKEQAENGQG